MQSVFVSILNFNGKDNTRKCLESIQGVETKGFALTVVVLDNGSKEKFDLIEQDYKDINLKILTNSVNSGFSGGHNTIIEYALARGADYVLVLNNDVVVDKNLIVSLLAGFKNSNVAATSPKIYFSEGSEYHKSRYKKTDLGKVIWYAGGKMDWANLIGHHRGVDDVDHGQYDKIEELELATGACIMFRADVLQKVGMFDDKYFLYYEDADLVMRIKKAEYKILYIPKAVLWHHNAGSSGGSGSVLQDYYISRNRLLFGLQYAPLKTKILLIKEGLTILFKGRQWQKRGVFDFFRMKFGRGSFPV